MPTDSWTLWTHERTTIFKLDTSAHYVSCGQYHRHKRDTSCARLNNELFQNKMNKTPCYAIMHLMFSMYTVLRNNPFYVFLENNNYPYQTLRKYQKMKFAFIRSTFVCECYYHHC